MNNSVSLSEANFDYVYPSVSGTASTLYVLGMGGLSKTAIVEHAKQDLLRQRPLKSNEGLANITVNWKNTFYLIVSTTECTVTADIVRFRMNDEAAQTEEDNQSTLLEIEPSNGTSQSFPQPEFQVGDSVEFRSAFQRATGPIIKIENEFYFMRYKKINGKEKTIKTTADWLKKVNSSN